jgi:AraC-like DNA-binding protein
MEQIMRLLRDICFVALLGIVTLTSCEEKKVEPEGEIPATIIHKHADSLVYEARFTGDFERFLRVTDSLANKGELSQIRADGYRGIAYFQLGQLEKCVECFQRATAAEVPPAQDFWEYIHAGTNLVIIMNSQRDYDTAMRTALRLIELLKQVDSPQRAGEMQTLYLCLGDTQMMLERHEEAMESYNEAYYWVRKTPNNSTARPLAACFQTLENIAVSFIDHELPEAEVWVNRMDSVLALYDKEPKAEKKEIDIFHALVNLHRAQVLQLQGNNKEAEQCYKEFEKSNYGKTLEGRINGCDYLLRAHRYAEAADNYTNLDKFIKDWGYVYDLETIGKNLLPKLRSNYYAERKDSALSVAMQIAEVYDSALIRQKRSESSELAAIYDTHGKMHQIAEQDARTRFFAVVNIAVAIVVLLILGFAIFMHRLWRNTKQRNRILVKQISDAIEYKEKYRKLKKAYSLPLHDDDDDKKDGGQSDKKQVFADDEETISSGNCFDKNGKAVIISDMTPLSDKQLFLCLCDLIENEQLYLQPNFGRQTLIERTGLSKEHIGAAFTQGGENITLPAYIRELRLDHAVKLLNDRSDLTVEQVCQLSGFTSADTFTRNFRNKYGMTPTTYKQLSKA